VRIGEIRDAINQVVPQKLVVLAVSKVLFIFFLFLFSF
jgi:hypothetical protein